MSTNYISNYQCRDSQMRLLSDKEMEQIRTGTVDWDSLSPGEVFLFKMNERNIKGFRWKEEDEMDALAQKVADKNRELEKVREFSA